MTSSCWLPFWFICREPCVPLSASLLVHPKGASLQCLREWCKELQATGSRWWGMCFAARSKKLSVLHSLGLCPGEFLVCSHPAQTQQLEWRWKCWGCIQNVPLSYHLGFVRVSQSFEADPPQPLLPSRGCSVCNQTGMVHSALRLQQTTNCLVGCKTWKLLKWNNISSHPEIC